MSPHRAPRQSGRTTELSSLFAHVPVEERQSRAASDDVVLTISFEGHLPVAVNGVSMALPELIESLSLIGGLRGIGYGDALPAPAAAILRAAYAAAGDSNSARLRLHAGACATLAAPTPELVNHP